jgi:ankyrin repeat protein
MESSIHIQIHKAFKSGDYSALKKLAGDTSGFPDCHLSEAFGHCLEYAIYHSPKSFIKEQLEKGSNPNYGDHAGFPAVIAALSSERKDVKEVIERLLEFGADINQKGINDWTPLHWAAANDNVEMIRFLLEKGANPGIRTGIDDYATPLEEAEILGCTKAVAFLKKVLD